MFAYCGNNPVSRADASGHAFVQVDYNFDDLPNDLFPEYGSSGGAGAVAGGYGILLGMKYSKNKDVEELYTATKDLIEASSIEDATSAVSKILDNVIVDGINSPNKIRTGYKRIKKGFTYLLVPVPTVAEDLWGMVLITSGVIRMSYGFVMTLVWGDEHL